MRDARDFAGRDGRADDGLRRRGFLAGLAAVQGAAMTRAATAMPGGTAAFRVIREGSEIGRHTLTLTREGTLTRARVLCEMRVGLGPITLFRYRHESAETWDGGRFMALDSRTDKNGTMLAVRASRSAGGIQVVQAHGSILSLPDDAVPFSHWNMAVTRCPLFDPESGVAAPEHVSCCGWKDVTREGAPSVPARRFDFSGRATISNWYDRDDRWVALEAVAPDRSRVVYRLIG